VDVLRDMGQRATQAETTIESYKKKLDELSDLRRQKKILENKNDEYMQHILELEEDVKKNDTWRPQLELFKKQVLDVRQQLHDETKKADRLAFDCKKLTEKVEAITIEKDRVVQERDELKEHVEELRCLNSAQSPSHRSGGPHSDLLSSDHQELWERLVRLRHENEQLKKAGNSGTGGGDLVLQAMLADLQERHDTVSAENRWGRRGDTSPHSPLSTPTPTHLASPPSSLIGSPSSSSMALLDAFSCLESPRKIRLLRKNLKWASESDLLVLRQPSLLSSFFSSFSSGQRNCGFSSFSSSGRGVSKASVALGLSPPNGLRKVSDCRLARPSSEGAQQIVVRHIHEFKVPSCGTEDSGCCRTSPSSCEDGPATMDSGVSGLFESVSPGISLGTSGLLECMGPGEDASGHRISDVILPFSSSSRSLTPFCCGVASTSSLAAHHLHHHHHHCSHCCRPPSRHHSCNGVSTHLSGAPTFSVSGRDTNNQQDSVVSSSTRHPSIRPPLPSDSPTPHNSPRVPMRVTVGRNRSSRSSLSPSHSSYSSLSEGEPAQSRSRVFLRSQSECLQTRGKSKDRNSAGSFSSRESLGNNLGRTSESQEREQKKNLFNAQDFKMDPVKTSTLIRNKASISADHIAFDKTQEMKVCQSFSGLEVSSGNNGVRFRSGKPVSVVRGVASAIQQHPAARSQPTSKSLTNSPIEGFVREPVPVKLADEANFWHKRNQVVSEVHQGTSLSSEVPVSSAGESPKLTSLTVKANLDSPPMPSRGSFNLETHFGMHDLSENCEPVTVVRPVNKSPNKHGNYVSFREPVTINVVTSPRSPVPPAVDVDAKPAAPAFRRSASLRGGRPTPALGDKSDIAQCSSGTLFTHQVLRAKVPSSSKLVPSRHQRSLSSRRTSTPSTSKSFAVSVLESDSDEDVLEQRLVAGAFGAPLVSSESCTSVSHDDTNDTDFTEYFTDNGSDTYDFLMPQQRLSYEDLQREHQKVLENRTPGSSLSSRFLTPHLRNSLSRIQEEDLIVEKSHKVQAAVFSSSTSHKIRKQDKCFKLSSNTRVKKKKRNKTAKMIATETFNAMFVFCTP
ncbi:Hook-related protein family, partial [Trinorchestia longiramus]